MLTSTEEAAAAASPNSGAADKQAAEQQLADEKDFASALAAAGQAVTEKASAEKAVAAAIVAEKDLADGKATAEVATADVVAAADEARAEVTSADVAAADDKASAEKRAADIVAAENVAAEAPVVDTTAEKQAAIVKSVPEKALEEEHPLPNQAARENSTARKEPASKPGAKDNAVVDVEGGLNKPLLFGASASQVELPAENASDAARCLSADSASYTPLLSDMPASQAPAVKSPPNLRGRHGNEPERFAPVSGQSAPIPSTSAEIPVVVTRAELAQAAAELAQGAQEIHQQSAAAFQSSSEALGRKREAARVAVHELRQQGASALQQGGEVLNKGAEAAHTAHQRGAEIFSQSANAVRHTAEAVHQGAETAHAHLQQGVGLLHQGTDAAHHQFQHGAEVCQRGLHSTSEAWKKAVPMLDQAVLYTNMAGAVTIIGFFFLGMCLICTPLHNEFGSFDRMFWVTQGVYLMVFSVPTLIATVQCGVYRRGFAGWPPYLQVDLWLGVLKFQLGRAIFFILSGFYVLPLMRNFNHMADVSLGAVIMSYLLGFVSLAGGVFLLVFDVVLAPLITRHAQHQAVPQSPEDPLE